MKNRHNIVYIPWRFSGRFSFSAFWQHRKNLLFAIPIFLLSSCWLTPERVNINDSKLNPLFSAMKEIDRASLGFTSVEPTDEIRIEEQSLFDKPYDIMLHIYGNSSRTISFKKIDGCYLWIGEQEIHQGPRKYETPDGTFNESITITFETIPISGHKLNTINISYLGSDSDKFGQNKLTLEQAQNMFKNWNE